MENEDFESIVEAAIKNIPQEFREKMENVNILVEDWPAEYQLHILRKRGEKGMLLGLYEGIPRTKRGRYGIGGQLPDKITVFRIPLLRVSENIKDLVRNIQNTVIHEIGHHFGMNEEQIRDAMKETSFLN
ncbi:metallopeptidase family protein [Candidatus Woesebacteria bacterium]|nr:metallopeptidase family protein [Candidatus Woesebacteria bacterium]